MPHFYASPAFSQPAVTSSALNARDHFAISGFLGFTDTFIALVWAAGISLLPRAAHFDARFGIYTTLLPLSTRQKMDYDAGFIRRYDADFWRFRCYRAMPGHV